MALRERLGTTDRREDPSLGALRPGSAVAEEFTRRRKIGSPLEMWRKMSPTGRVTLVVATAVSVATGAAIGANIDVTSSGVEGLPTPLPADGGAAGVPGPDQAPGAYNPSADCTNADGTGAFDIVRETVAQGNVPNQAQIDAAQACSDEYPGHFESVTNPNDVHEIIVYGRAPNG